MSTHDVPGANPVNHDELGQGCWAEHEDGSLIYVYSTEDNKVIYSVFDPSKAPMVEYRDAMLVGDFEKMFSTSVKDINKPTARDSQGRFTTKQLWTWHDKTHFPWDKVLDGDNDGPRFASAKAQISAAAKVAADLNLRAEQAGMGEKIARSGKRGIRQRLQDAISALRA